ncbi:hypothetical protein DKX38_015489 [Salix brachista]|uniref:Uncharacterized protein n=1 Tax=Salix brachista TaxID=2182728 RepID=A0A5N5L7B8_9ROSI|nr:hypothetical protein DKX38_015489 [Salix brachista]
MNASLCSSTSSFQIILSYSAEDEAKSETPVMIHRTILGSVERMLAILLEHCKGLLLLIVSVQVRDNADHSVMSIESLLKLFKDVVADFR